MHPASRPERLGTTGAAAQCGRTALASRNDLRSFPETPTKATITHRIIDAPNGTYGYEILADGKLLVRQTNIPGQPGNAGCVTKTDAEKLATLVAVKVKRGEMPPTVTKEELQQLSIIR
ncbi:MAG: DUF4907 domain-containing protein [Flavobacteriales bacterium]|nr:DUF4907 domain-containing protein [Flavobacteriales bacterium]